ncbi:MAG: thioredoxin [Candidatus Obscuribacterales bacterium]|nr:thioredoxin [Candidatus Obscuribacterales bacterium]
MSWFHIALSCFFAAGVLFYLFRLCNPLLLRSVNGYVDAENEFWHAACLLGMVACLTPSWLPLPTIVWNGLFIIGTAWYLIRAFTYGLKLPHNKQWYDLAHAAMLFGMWWMFVAPLKHPLVTWLFAAYWGWFGSYYALRLWADCKKPHWLPFGQDIAHFGMALVMLAMTVAPAYFMAHHQHAIANELGLGPDVVFVNDSNFQSEVFDTEKPVVLLVFGGCEKCAAEVPLFDDAAKALSANHQEIKFACLHKDDCPLACATLRVEKCPTILLIKNKRVIADIESTASPHALETFIEKHLKS